MSDAAAALETPAVARERMAEDPPTPTLVELLSERARSAPDREFLRFGDESWTFAEIDAWTSRLAHRLIEVDGVGVGDRVAIMLPNVVHWPVVWLAALKARAVAVPVNSSYQKEDLTFILRDSGARIVFSTGSMIGLLDDVARTEPDLAGLRIIDVADDGSDHLSSQTPDLEVVGSTLANLQYTSGTTGFPKACMLTHDYWVRLGWVCAAVTGLGADDVILTAQPFSYMDPQWNTALALTIGAPLVVLPRFSASGFFADVRRHRATFCYVLGAMPTLLLKQPPDGDDRDNDLRLVLCSGIPAGLHRHLEQRWGAPWREIYGMTESGCDLVSVPEATTDVASGNLGRPIPTKRVRVVDADGVDVADGEPGELITSGKPVMLGYWNREDATSRTLRDGWLHTGDVVVRRANRYHLVGRLKDMVRRGGENIASAEVEAALERDDLVVATAVIGEADETFGEEIKAFVQLRAGVPAERRTAEEIIDRVRNQLARFKVPRYVEFVEDFPRTPSERVAKPALVSRSVENPGVTHDVGQKSSADHLEIRIERGVAVVTLCRPDKLNAIDVATRVRLASTIRAMGTGDDVRGIVLTGTGRAFSAGEDLDAAPASFADVRAAVETFHDITRAILHTKVPVIAAVNGIAVGGASEITLCCDARIGTPATEYFQPENGRGIAISNASSVLLPRLVRNHAMRMVLASPRIGADEALRIGLLDEIVAPDRLLDRAIELIVAWTPPHNTTDLHLALLRPQSDEIEAAFAREDVAAKKAWETGVFSAGIADFRSAQGARDQPRSPRTRTRTPQTTTDRS